MERSTARRLWTWVPLFGAFVVAWAVLSIPGVQSYLTLQGAPPLATAAAADAPVLGADLVFTCADGSTFNGEDLRGKPAVITVFAMWCPPCMQPVCCVWPCCNLSNVLLWCQLLHVGLRLVGVILSAGQNS